MADQGLIDIAPSRHLVARIPQGELLSHAGTVGQATVLSLTERLRGLFSFLEGGGYAQAREC